MPVLKKHQDPIGQAVWDYHNGIRGESILVKMNIAEDEELSPAYFFRTFEQMPIQEQEALKRCSGKILDVGAGAGVHSIWLQNQGFDVDSLDISPLSCEIVFIQSQPCIEFSRMNAASVLLPTGRIDTSQRLRPCFLPTVMRSLQVFPPLSE